MNKTFFHKLFHPFTACWHYNKKPKKMLAPWNRCKELPKEEEKYVYYMFDDCLQPIGAVLCIDKRHCCICKKEEDFVYDEYITSVALKYETQE